MAGGRLLADGLAMRKPVRNVVMMTVKFVPKVGRSGRFKWRLGIGCWRRAPPLEPHPHVLLCCAHSRHGRRLVDRKSTSRSMYAHTKSGLYILRAHKCPVTAGEPSNSPPSYANDSRI
jgi:hypothetical protein